MFSLLLFAMVASAAAHEMGSWGCPKVKGMKVDMDRFQGKWFVIKKVNTKMSCITDHFSTLPEPGSYNYTERQQMLNQIIFHETVIKTKNGKKMIDYPLIIPDAELKVLFTDYDNYAVIYKCQSVPIFHRWSASVLSRTPEMTTEEANMHEQNFHDVAKAHRNTKMDFIDWSNCVTDDDAHFTIGMGPDLSIRPGGQVLTSVVDGFKGLAGDAGDGIENIYKEVKDFIDEKGVDPSKEDIEFF